jgi:cyclase
VSNVSVIPRLDVKGYNVIKGVHIKCLRVVGDPEEITTKYNNNGADEVDYISTNWKKTSRKY